MTEIKKGVINRGVSLYSYSEVFGATMTLEDCFMDMQDMGATCVEILTGHMANYPHPPTEWVDTWFRYLDKYGIEPASYGHWVNDMYKNRPISDDEIIKQLERDFRLAHLLGFKNTRTRLESPNWQELTLRMLDYAEKYDICVTKELGNGSRATSKNVVEYIEFIDKIKTDRLGFCIDFSMFQNKFPVEARMNDFIGDDMEDLNIFQEWAEPEEIIPLLPYTKYCHAKFKLMSENFEEETMPYKEVCKLMVDNGWSGYMVSEYEGSNKEDTDFVSDQLRRQHIMMKRIFGY